MSLHRRSMLALGAVAVLGAGVAVHALWPQPPVAPPAAPTPAPVAPAMAPVAAPAQTASAPAVAAAASSPAPALVDCPHQALDLAWADRTERACVGAARIVQTGSRRSYVFEPEGAVVWRLQVDWAGGQPLAVRLTRAGGAREPVRKTSRRWACARSACAGLTVDRPDAQGERRLTLQGVALQGDGPVRLQARLALPPDGQVPALACDTAAGPPLRIVERGGAGVQEFCPLGGGGFELDADGRRRYLFTNLEGETLLIALAADGSVERVQWRGQRCAAPACDGVSQAVQGDAADPGAARSFHFAGQTLRAARPGEPGVTLDGSVSMAAQTE